jgi:hypothetical protein|tara:strand:- start:72 stop:893 length:822 start_codon:yes stop_codon:yes gene_type:complete
MKVLFTFILLSGVCFGQSKKAQIEALNKSLDSLELVLTTTRDNSAKDIGELNATIQGLSAEIAQMKSEVSNIEASETKLKKEVNKLKLDLAELSKKNLDLEAKLKLLEETASSNLITDESIGDIKLGMNLNEVRSFYDVVKIPEEVDEGTRTIYFYHCKSDGKKLFHLLLNETEEVRNFYTESDIFKTIEGFQVGMSAAELKKIYKIDGGSGEGGFGILINIEGSQIYFMVSYGNKDVNNLYKYDYWSIGGDNLPDDLIIDGIGVIPYGESMY